MAKAPDSDQPIVVRRGRGSNGHEHHGGSWKVAFADFAMAMMALFLVLWLVAATTPVQKEAIATYFSNPGLLSRVSSNSPVEMQGDRSILPGIPVQIRPKPSGMTGMELAGHSSASAEGSAAIVLGLAKLSKEQANGAKDIQLQTWPRMVRMTLVQDKVGPMFPPGSRQLVPFYEDFFIALAQVLAKLPFKIIITGHSDGVIGSDLKNSIEPNRANWELAGQRAETVREVIVFSGVPEDQILLLAAMGTNQPIPGLDPESGLNRRVDLMLVPRKDAKGLSQEFQHKRRKEKASSPVPSSDMEKAIQQARDNRYPGP
ncbi:OmpA family protein [Thalassotalea sp. G20_0]|uniref:flagellar motor protein MotB n=1 Tax=Thalassotalea sp. G20_0 TaxID=2821093 RepID=UPI001ADC2A84|nr:flagellar motor protein MotB [Thalassotalea sp. G20_0]MBO9495294.1 OmpA family protein [Thalassotalea sp. G20_0]